MQITNKWLTNERSTSQAESTLVSSVLAIIARVIPFVRVDLHVKHLSCRRVHNAHVVRERCLRKRGGPATFHLACLADGSRAETHAPGRRTCGIQLSIVAASVRERPPIGGQKRRRLRSRIVLRAGFRPRAKVPFALSRRHTLRETARITRG